ncbi:protein-tyrosine phosphatase family protein [Mucisphaera calidilacus]|uniref:Tyrosine specific protein phosphatases domain-containing protein n=1 Tax=Mucisphaera calidilacus TaxID=2527982 RepID=A0A518BY70_9BACT|nr:tyrosine-protein phosphatase [Mucisphaera calidilacus]QDU71925.1 hypothetical protein Pan265_17840 [Mucisphaera calidilacus]
MQRSSDSASVASDPPPVSVAPPVGRHWKRALVVALIVVTGVLVWDVVLKDRLIAKRLGEVVPGEVYRSGQISEHLIESVLAGRGIDVVIDFTGIRNGPNPEQAAETAAIARLGVEGHRFPLAGDGTGDPESYVRALVVLREAMAEGQQVLMHCAAGSQRTGAAVGFYRLFYEGWTPEQVIEELKRYDWSPSKDQILLAYMNEHMRLVASRLVEEGVLEAVPDPLPVMPMGEDG